MESKSSAFIHTRFTLTATCYRDVCYDDWKKAKKGPKKAFEAHWKSLPDNEKEVRCTIFDLDVSDSDFVITSRMTNEWRNL